MASKQSVVLNKVSVLMPNLWLRVDREQKTQSLPFFSISFPGIFENESNTLEMNWYV